MKTKPIKVGDSVVIKTPRLFDRVGYALTPDNVKDDVLKKYDKELEPFIKIFGLDMLRCVDPNKKPSCREFDAILHALCRKYVRDQSFGGNVRKVYSKDSSPKWQDKVLKVLSFRFVHEGKYYPASGGYDPYTGESDYEPAYIADRKVVKILTVGNDWSWNECEIRSEFVEVHHG